MERTITVYGRTYELDFSQEGSVLLTYTSRGFTTLARVGIKTNSGGVQYACSTDLSVAASDTIGKRARVLIIAELNHIIEVMRHEKAQEEAQEAPEEETTQSRVTLVVNDKVFEFIHNQGATQILVKPQGEKSFFIPSPYSTTSEESLERIGLDYLKRELMTFDIITTQDKGDGVEVLRHDTDSRVVGQQFDLQSFMRQMLKNRQVDDLTVHPIRNGMAGKKTVYGITYDISIVQVGRIAYAIRLQTQNTDIQEAHFIEEDLEDGVRVYQTFDMFGNYSGTAEIDKEYRLVDYYHE